jgi:hypothetical protein
MTTVADFARIPFGLLQIVSPVQAIKAQDMATFIQVLNAVCRRLEANGIALGWQPVENPSDTLPMQIESELGVAYQTALTMAPMWGVAPMPAVVAGAQQYMEDLRRDQAVATPIQPILDAPMPYRWGYGQWRSGWFN